MTYVRDSFWKGRELASLTLMQADALRWSTEVAGGRHCRALEGAQPLRVFEAIERDALIALPPRTSSTGVGSVSPVLKSRLRNK